MDTPAISYDVSAGHWSLQSPFWFWSGEILVEIPEGYKFDMASVPRVFWLLIAPFELGVRSPLVHDFLYSTRGHAQNEKVSRRYVDKLFRKMMREEGVPRWRYNLGYLAVRIAGWALWFDLIE